MLFHIFTLLRGASKDFIKAWKDNLNVRQAYRREGMNVDHKAILKEWRKFSWPHLNLNWKREKTDRAYLVVFFSFWVVYFNTQMVYRRKLLHLLSPSKETIQLDRNLLAHITQITENFHKHCIKQSKGDKIMTQKSVIQTCIFAKLKTSAKWKNH